MEDNITEIANASRTNDIMSSEICYRVALDEYNHTIQRAGKLENKIYILITFCSLYSSFILGLFDDFFNLHFPKEIKEYVLTTAYIILFLMMCALYIYILVSLIKSLRAITIKRYDPNHIFSESLYNKPQIAVYMLIAKKYTECTNDNNAILTIQYEYSEKINQRLIVLVIVSFAIKLISYFL